MEQLETIEHRNCTVSCTACCITCYKTNRKRFKVMEFGFYNN